MNKFANSPYNKTVYTAVIGIVATFGFGYLGGRGIEVPFETQSVIVGALMALTTFLVPNKS